MRNYAELIQSSLRRQYGVFSRKNLTGYIYMRTVAMEAYGDLPLRVGSQ